MNKLDKLIEAYLDLQEGRLDAVLAMVGTYKKMGKLSYLKGGKKTGLSFLSKMKGVNKTAPSWWSNNWQKTR